ncbi:MAG: hypothetical protein Q7T96_00895 [Methylobacter sp.]|nr:hypothetical protein [Methylobacter sp.]
MSTTSEVAGGLSKEIQSKLPRKVGQTGIKKPIVFKKQSVFYIWRRSSPPN